MQVGGALSRCALGRRSMLSVACVCESGCFNQIAPDLWIAACFDDSRNQFLLAVSLNVVFLLRRHAIRPVDAADDRALSARACGRGSGPGRGSRPLC